jgi:hypothetical protein
MQLLLPLSHLHVPSTHPPTPYYPLIPPQAQRKFNNIEEGFYISPAFLDKITIHVAKVGGCCLFRVHFLCRPVPTQCNVSPPSTPHCAQTTCGHPRQPRAKHPSPPYTPQPQNFMDLPKIKVPLILGIWGGKGQGKTFQCGLAFKKLGIAPIVMSAGELESGNAGEPAKLIRQRYREASDIIKKKGQARALGGRAPLWLPGVLGAGLEAAGARVCRTGQSGGGRVTGGARAARSRGRPRGSGREALRRRRLAGRGRAPVLRGQRLSAGVARTMEPSSSLSSR